MQVKVKGLAASNVRAEAEAKLKSKELDILGKKMDLETKKAAVELNILVLQEKEQLLLTRKRLIDAGVPIEEVDATLPKVVRKYCSCLTVHFTLYTNV
jgi:hypothetical protein